LNKLFQAYGDDVQFVIVYIAEAHALDSRSPIVGRGPLLEEPATLEERLSHAGKCMAGLGLDAIPAVVDKIDDKIMQAYDAWPDRLYLISKNGKVAYKGGRGPMDFKPEKLEAAIKKELHGAE
jgi:iodothyronine deiodinase-like protein